VGDGPVVGEPTAVNPGGISPSDMSVYIFTSDDGLDFEKRNFVAKAAVPHMMQAENGDLIATFQYFKDEEVSMGSMAYSVSEDLGLTWSDPVVLDIVDLPGVADQKTAKKPTMPQPVDPTLAQLEDGRFRIYFTYHEVGYDYPGPASAIADSMDGEFEYEGKLFESNEAYILDPSVVYFDGLWHYFTSSNGLNSEKKKGDVQDYVAYHAISEDGQEFELQDKLSVEFSMLGGAVVTDDGIRFFGSDPDGKSSGFSEDGYEWELVEEAEGRCSDPGTVYLGDDSYIMLCQSSN
jgi:hypothetical protein